MKKNIFNNRRFKHGSLATIMTIGLIVLVVLVNIIASMVADRLPVNIDLTDNQMYELSQESVDYVKQLKEPVTIEVFASEDDFNKMGQMYGFEQFTKQAMELFKKYSLYGDVTVNYLDPYTNPDILSKYPKESLGLEAWWFPAGTVTALSLCSTCLTLIPRRGWWFPPKWKTR